MNIYTNECIILRKSEVIEALNLQYGDLAGHIDQFLGSDYFETVHTIAVSDIYNEIQLEDPDNYDNFTNLCFMLHDTVLSKYPKAKFIIIAKDFALNWEDM